MNIKQKGNNNRKANKKVGRAGNGAHGIKFHKLEYVCTGHGQPLG
jgi:hypothetical protein